MKKFNDLNLRATEIKFRFYIKGKETKILM